MVRWPGHIKPGTVKKEMFAALDWLPTLVDIAGGPKGDALRLQIETGSYPGIVKTTLDGLDQRPYLEGTSDKSARDVFFYYSGATPSAVRYKNWKMYYSMAPGGAAGWFLPLVNYHWTLVANVKRTPSNRLSALGIQSQPWRWAVHSAPHRPHICTTGTCCRSASGVMVWAVLAPSTNLAAGALTGEYGGLTAGAAAGVGGDANVLIGGSTKSISLQPVSVEGDKGINVAAGIAAISLQYQS